MPVRIEWIVVLRFQCCEKNGVRFTLWYGCEEWGPKNGVRFTFQGMKRYPDPLLVLKAFEK